MRLSTIPTKRFFWRVALLAGMLGVLVPKGHAQEQSINPQKWFPLEIGSYWHYLIEDRAFRTDQVLHASRDTMINALRWVGIETAYCSSAVNCYEGHIRWYRFTEDNYLLRFSEPDADTVFVTYAYSVFTVKAPGDTLQSSRVEDLIIVTVEETEEGNEADSTNLELFIDGGTFFFLERFIYKVGRKSGLIGAKVGDIEYGDISLITSVALDVEDEEIPLPDDFVELHIYPQPGHGPTTIELIAPDYGRYEIAVYNLLGQRLFSEEQSLNARQVWKIDWNASAQLSRSVYFVQITRDGLVLAQRPIVVSY